jgi:hypothetical protein
MQIIPFKEPAAWTAQITLTSQIFILSFRWNALNQYWVMSIFDSNNLPILLGVKVVTNFNLTAQFDAINGMPQGDIVCQNIIDTWTTIGRFDMGETNEIIYYDPGELAAQAQARLAAIQKALMENQKAS